MDKNKRNQQSQAGSEEQRNTSNNHEGTQQDAANETDQNSQRGDSWGETQTRDTGNDQSESGENFYHNRDRGNYDPNRTSDDGGGGTLF